MDKILRKTQRDYNIIAAKFRETRRKIKWQDLKSFLTLVKEKDRVLDVGCGTGRLYRQLKSKKIDYLGVDFVSPFLEGAKKDYPQAKFLLADINQPQIWKKIKGNFDVILCVAVLHHFPTRKTQGQLLRQMRKKLKKDGILILTVWNLWRKRFTKLHLKQIAWKIFKGFKFNWLLVPFKVSDGRKTITQVNRFMYAFSPKELSQLLEKTGYEIIRKKIANNLCFACKKKD